MNERILIVDDTPANIQMLMAILKKEGYQLSAATNGRQALEVIEKVAPDLVLMDVMMPDMDGYEACERIKASTRWRDLLSLAMWIWDFWSTTPGASSRHDCWSHARVFLRRTKLRRLGSRE